MLKKFTSLFLYVTRFTAFGVISSPQVRAQTGPVGGVPTAFYRFQISFWDGGHLLTHFYNEGAANGHLDVTFIHPVLNSPMGIYRPPDGYTPDPSSGLVRLHRWRVVQSGWRVYYYYSTLFSTHGSDYHYEGVAGWVFPAGTQSVPANGAPLAPLAAWYSTDLGYWWEFRNFLDQTAEFPPNRSGKSNYVLHGQTAALPPACINPQFPSQVAPGDNCVFYVVQFNPPPPPPPPSSCSASLAIKAKCAQLGGFWDDDLCACQY